MDDTITKDHKGKQGHTFRYGYFCGNSGLSFGLLVQSNLFIIIFLFDNCGSGGGVEMEFSAGTWAFCYDRKEMLQKNTEKSLV